MNHRTYDGQRFSPLDRINKDNVKNLKLAYAVPLGGGAGNEFTRRRRSSRTASSTSPIPGACSTRSTARPATSAASSGAWIPKQERQQRNRGAALWGNLVITGAGIAPPRIIATDKETGKVVWETTFTDTPDVTFTAAPLAIKDKIIVGAASGDHGVRDWIGAARCRDRQAAVAQIHHSGARRARQRDLEGQEQRLADRRRRRLGHRHLRSRHQPDHLGHRQSGADVRSDLPAGRQSLHQQRDLLGSRHRQDELVLPVHARRHVGLRRGRHPHPDRRRWSPASRASSSPIRRATASSTRWSAATARSCCAKPYMDINWTKGIDQKTGKPLDYDPGKDIQTYSGVANLTPGRAAQEGLSRRRPAATITGRRPTARKTKLLYIPALSNCVDRHHRHARSTARRAAGTAALCQTAERYESNLTAVDPLTGEIKKNVHLRYPELQRHARDRRRARVHRAARRHRRGLRRHHARRAVEDQRRLGLLGAADDLRGQRQAVCRDRVGAEPGRETQARQHAGAQGAAQRDWCSTCSGCEPKIAQRRIAAQRPPPR